MKLFLNKLKCVIVKYILTNFRYSSHFISILSWLEKGYAILFERFSKPFTSKSILQNCVQEVQCIHQCYITKTPTTTKRFSSLKFRKRKKTNESSDSENLITFDLTDLNWCVLRIQDSNRTFQNKHSSNIRKMVIHERVIVILKIQNSMKNFIMHND